jgi:hypothetical protein
MRHFLSVLNGVRVLISKDAIVMRRCAWDEWAPGASAGLAPQSTRFLTFCQLNFVAK